MSNEFFFRNDDVRSTLDSTLVDMQELFIKHSVPIIHAVEPANVTPEVVDWLLDMRRVHPDLFEIMQHGYDHTIKNKEKKGEFGGQRGYDEQYEDIRKGKELMNLHFGSDWFEAFNFPYAPYNELAIKALQSVGYKVLNSHYNAEWKRKLFYAVGHLLGKGMMFDHHVSWNLQKYPGTTMWEISMNITFIKKYYDENTSCEFYTFDELKNKIDKYIPTPYPIGLLLHHRYHVTQESMDLIEQVFDYLRMNNVAPVSMRAIYERLESRG